MRRRWVTVMAKTCADQPESLLSRPVASPRGPLTLASRLEACHRSPDLWTV